MKRRAFILTVILAAGAVSCGKTGADVTSRTPITVDAAADRTKAMVPSSVLPDGYTIYLSSYLVEKNIEANEGDYFVAEPFNRRGDRWSATPERYWPLASRLDFLALACEADSLDVASRASWHPENCTQGVEVDVPDGSCLMSELLYASAGNSRSTDGVVPMHFSHSQDWLHIIVNCEDDILRIDGITVENAHAGGVLRITNGIYVGCEWLYRFSGHSRRDILVPGSAGVCVEAGADSCFDVLLPEQEACDIVIRYSMKSSADAPWDGAVSATYRNPAIRDTWYAGMKNTYEYTFSFDAVRFTATVTDWGEDEQKYVELETE